MAENCDTIAGPAVSGATQHCVCVRLVNGSHNGAQQLHTTTAYYGGEAAVLCATECGQC
jgi:hypothetical protein